MLLLRPLSLGLIDVLKIFVSEVSLVHGSEVAGGRHLLRTQDLIEYAGPREVVYVLGGAAQDVLNDSIDDPLEPWIVGSTGNKIIADFPCFNSKIKFGDVWRDVPMKRPNEVGVNVHVDTAVLLEHQ